MTDDAGKLEQMITYDHSCISICTDEEQEALEMVRHVALNLKKTMWIWSAGRGLREGMLKDSQPFPETELLVPGLVKMAEVANGSICVTLDIADNLGNKLNLRMLRDTIALFRKTENVLIMINSSDNLPDIVKSYSKIFEMSLPDEEEIRKCLYQVIRELHNKKPFEIGMTKGGMKAVVRNLMGLTRRQVVRILKDCVVDDDRLDDSDINRALASKRLIIQQDGLLEYVQTPLNLDEIGGLKNLKEWLELRRNSFTRQAQHYGVTPPKGIMILGVQGAGKSLCAKAVATAWQKPLFRLDPGVLYASYVGQSESNLRDALRQTEAMAPVILWIDEIEKGFASAASQSIDGGLSKRMFGTLLTWMQEHKAPVFLIATANDIDVLPPELLRKGRFDEIFFVGLPDAKARSEIFKIHIAKRGRSPDDFDLEKLATCAEGFSGAEIEQAVVCALHRAFAEKKDLTLDHILTELKLSPPLSVTMAESIDDLCQWAQGRCVPAD